MALVKVEISAATLERLVAAAGMPGVGDVDRLLCSVLDRHARLESVATMAGHVVGGWDSDEIRTVLKEHVAALETLAADLIHLNDPSESPGPKEGTGG